MMRTTVLGLTLVMAAGVAVAEPCTLGGTFLTLKAHDVAAEDVEAGRTMLSFLPAGNMVMVEAAQGGVKGFQPFSDARGEWQCEAAADGRETFRAVLFDFTFATASAPDQKIARVDIEGVYADNTIDGRARISFYPIAADPMDKGAGADMIGYDFTGERLGFAQN